MRLEAFDARFHHETHAQVRCVENGAVIQDLLLHGDGKRSARFGAVGVVQLGGELFHLRTVVKAAVIDSILEEIAQEIILGIARRRRYERFGEYIIVAALQERLVAIRRVDIQLDADLLEIRLQRFGENR